MASEAFYLPAGDGRYAPTEATTSPWDPAAQHGGPPTALLATVMDLAVADPGLRLARITAEFLGPVPRREVAVTATVTRPGRRVVMTEASLAVDDRPAMIARAWHISAASRPPAGVSPPPAPPHPGPDELTSQPPETVTGSGSEWGYGAAIDWRFTEGGFDTPGPAGAWTSLKIPFIAGEATTGLQRALVVADSANGISHELAFGEWMFIPTSVTVHLRRHPAGPWVHLGARTTLGSDGVGLTTGTLADTGGPLGTVDQPLLLVPMP